jgi:hypothetical protein
LARRDENCRSATYAGKENLVHELDFNP